MGAWLDTVFEGLSWLRDRWRYEREPEGMRFDLDHGVDTAKWTLDYEPIRPSVLRDVLDALPAVPERTAFFDLGCGKGRALLVASERPFRRVCGVEVVEGLADTCRRNLAVWDQAHEACGEIEVLHADAADVPLPPTDVVVFLYNPFGAEVVRAVVNRLLTGGPGRRVWLAYVNPLEAGEVQAPPWRVIATGGAGTESWRVYELVS